jgi:hypothetical protein
VLNPVSEHAIGLAAAASTAVENLENRALDEEGLRAFLRLPDNCIAGLLEARSLDLRKNH